MTMGGNISEELLFYDIYQDLPFSIFLCADYKSDWHYHKYFELIYCLNGQYGVMVNGHEYECTVGDFVIVHIMEPHVTEPLSIGAEIFCLQLDSSFFDNNCRIICESQYLLPFIRKNAPYKQYFHTEQNDILRTIVSEMMNEYQYKRVGFEMSISGNILRLFANLGRRQFIEISNAQINIEEYRRIKPIIDQIETEYNGDMNVTQAASIACMSYYHFCRLFKKITGKTFVEYHNFIRLRKAEKLLRTTTKTITEIAFEIGFGSAAYFSRVYKKEYGKPPIRCRKRA